MYPKITYIGGLNLKFASFTKISTQANLTVLLLYCTHIIIQIHFLFQWVENTQLQLQKCSVSDLSEPWYNPFDSEITRPKMPGLFRSSQLRNSYALLDDESLNHDENNLLAQDSQLNTDIPSNYISDDSDSETSFRIFNLKQFHIPKINFAYFKQSRGKRLLDVGICIICLLFIVNVSIWLGYNTLLYHTPVIDKSYRAFGIPNHEAWLNFGALQAAKKNHTPFYHGSLDPRKTFGGGNEYIIILFFLYTSLFRFNKANKQVACNQLTLCIQQSNQVTAHCTLFVVNIPRALILSTSINKSQCLFYQIWV